MAITVDDGNLVAQDPNDKRVYQFDFDAANLAAGVQLASVGTFTITVVEGLNTTPLQKDSEALVTGNRKTRLRLFGGTPGTTYKVENEVDTNETPSQRKNKKFFVLIEDQ